MDKWEELYDRLDQFHMAKWIQLNEIRGDLYTIIKQLEERIDWCNGVGIDDWGLEQMAVAAEIARAELNDALPDALEKRLSEREFLYDKQPNPQLKG